MRIRSQLLLVLTGVTLLPVCAAGLIAYRLSKNRLLTQADNHLAIFARLVAGEVDDFVFRAVESARTDTLIPQFVEHLQRAPAERTAHRAQVAQLLQDATRHDPVHVTSCALFDRAGNKLVENAPDLTAIEEGNQPWVTQAFQEGLPVVVASFSDPQRPVLWVGAPVRRGDGTIVGLLRLRYELAALQQIVVRHYGEDTAGQFAVVINDTGKFLAHGGDARRIGASVPSRLLDELERESGAFAPARRASVRWLHPTQTSEPPDRIMLQTLQHAPWTVAIVSTDARYRHAVTELRDTMVLLGGLAVVLVVAAAAVAAARLGRPIVELANTSERIGRGDLTVQAWVGGGEVGTLARTFNEMVARLRASRAELENQVRELQQSRERLERLVADLPVAAAITDATFFTVRTNRMFKRLTGYTEADMPTLESWWAMAYPDPRYREEIRAEWTRRTEEALQLAREVRPLVATVHCKDGRDRHIEFHARPLGDMFVTTLIDLTEREESARALRESEERFRLLVENSNELIVLVSLEGTILYASPNHAAITGRTPETLVGHSIREHVHPDDLLSVATQQLEGRTNRLYRYRFASGSWHWLESSGARFKTGEGVEQAVIVSRDVTDRVKSDETRRQLEEQLRQAQKLEAIGTLAGGIAHDFNNILLGILGNTQLAAEELPENHPAHALLAESHVACLRARDLVARILTFSRRTDPKLEATFLGPVITEALQLLRASLPAGIDVRSQLDPATPAVLCDSTQIHQIVMNLGSNAGHAMKPRGGTISVELAPVVVTAPLIARFPQLREDFKVRLAVSDTGMGMDEATLRRLFEPFFTTKPVGEGTGLGLAVVHGLLRSLGGAVTVESTVGVGTTFTLYLPAAPSAAAAPAVPVALPAPAPRTAKSPTARGNGQRIALVDDEDVVRRVCERALRQLGYKAVTFSRAKDLLEALNNGGGEFDLVISDLTMPGMSGVELTRELKKLRPGLPVILASGNSTRTNPAELHSAGVVEIVEKPFSIENLGTTIGRVLGRAP